MYPTIAKYTFFSNLQHLQKLTRYWTMKPYLNKFYLKLSDNNAIKLEINNKNITANSLMFRNEIDFLITFESKHKS